MKKKKFGKTLLIVAGMTAVLFIGVEGLSSIGVLVYDLSRYSRKPLTERVHTRHDPLLGWINLPNLDIPDLYGPGTRFRTNSQGFRGDRDFTAAVPPGRMRVICLGDSFTLGYGVGDDEAWCRVLTTLDSKLETVNMGQGGYGLDQDYLWYLRDGSKLSADVLVFSFITEDFFRIARDNFLGYGKPMLEVQGDRLVTTHVPVPRRSYYFPWVTQNAPIFRTLRSLELFGRILGWEPRGMPGSFNRDTGKIQEVASRVFGDLQERMRQRGGVLVLVYLPIPQDYAGHTSDPWKEFVRTDAERRGIPFLDLVEELRKLPADQAARMFREHYSEEGHRFVAAAIRARVRSLAPETDRTARYVGTPDR